MHEVPEHFARAEVFTTDHDQAGGCPRKNRDIVARQDGQFTRCDGVAVDQSSVIGAGCEIGPRAAVSGSILWEKASVGEGARIGANAVVVTDVEPNTTMVGIPARAVGRVRARPVAAPAPLPLLLGDAARSSGDADALGAR